MKKLLILLVLSVLLLGCSSKSVSENKANKMGVEIAKKVKELYNSTENVEGWEYLEMNASGKTYNDSLKFIVKKPDKIWMYDSTYNAYLISNGTYTWIYDKDKNTVKVEKETPSHPPDYVRFIDGMLTVFNVSYVGNKTFDGVNCYVIKLTPNATNVNVYGYAYVTPNYKLKGIYFKLNNIEYNIVFENVSYNVSVNSSLFNFTPPKGAKVYRVIESLKIHRFKDVKKAQKYAKFKILVPSYTNGYEISSICVYGYNVLLEYTNGSKEMLIKETTLPTPYSLSSKEVRIDNVTIHVWTENGRNVAYFKKGNLTVIVNAPMNEKELLKICSSIIEQS